jgi:hypothetical protein
VFAPTNEAIAQLSAAVRGQPQLVRQLLLGHICTGVACIRSYRAPTLDETRETRLSHLLCSSPASSCARGLACAELVCCDCTHAC